MIPTIRHQYDGKQQEISQATGLNCKDRSLTKQSDAESADINNILKRYEKTGSLPDLIRENPVYGDFASMPDFQAAQDLVLLARAQFDALDAPVRRRFSNDPASFLDFATNADNLEEMVKLGLATKKVDIALPPSQPVPSAPVAPAAGGSK